MPDIVREIPPAPSTIEELQKYVEEELVKLRQDLYSLVNDDASFNTGITGNVVIPNGGTVGQVAGPLLTFDDTNDYLEISGCRIVVGDTIAGLIFDIKGPSGYPAITGSTQTGVLRVRGTSNSVLDMGSAGVAPFGNWIQSIDKASLQTEYPLLLNPNGGNVGVGTKTPGSKLAAVGLPIYANNAAAITGGLAAGDFYRTNANPDPVNVVH